MGINLIRLLCVVSLGFFVACGEDNDPIYRCEVANPSGAGTELKICFDYELSPLGATQADTFEGQCTAQGGVWAKDASCSVSAGQRGCKLDTGLVTFTTWYTGDGYTNEFWGLDTDSNGKDFEQETKEGCESSEGDDPAGQWITKS